MVAYSCQCSLKLQISPLLLFAPRGQPEHAVAVGSLNTVDAYATCRFTLRKSSSCVLFYNDCYIANAFFPPSN